MKKIKKYLIMAILSFVFCNVSLAQDYSKSDMSQGQGSITIIDDNVNDKSFFNVNKSLPKTNEFKEDMLILIGLFLLVVGFYLTNKNKKEVLRNKK